MDNKRREILTGSERAFLDSSVLSQPFYTPQFMTNSGQEKVITLLDEELKEFDEFLVVLHTLLKKEPAKAGSF